MLGAGRRHLGRQARGLGVVFPHDPLQLGEFVDHLGGEVGLADPRGFRRKVGSRADKGRDLARQRLDPGDAVALAAKLVVEGDVRKRRRHPLEPLRLHRAQVVLPEEPRVRQPRAQHLAVARKDQRAVVRRLDVGDGHELLDPARPGVPDREELLMLLHRGAQHLGRQAKEGRVDVAHEHDGPFHEPRDLGQKARVLDKLQPLREGPLPGVVQDVLGPLFGRQDHVRALQLRRVVVEGRHGEAARGQERVARGRVAGGQPLDLEGNDGRARLIGQKTQDRPQRPHPAQAPRPPAHRLRPREVADRAVEHLGHDPGGRAARLVDHGDEDLPLLVVAHLKRVARQPGRPQEPLDGRVGRVGAGALPFLLERGAFRQKPLDRQRQAARGREGGGMGIGQTGLDQPVGHQALQVLGGAGLHPGGDFLGQKFDQQIGHHSVPCGGGGQPSGAGCPSKTSSPHSLIWCQA